MKKMFLLAACVGVTLAQADSLVQTAKSMGLKAIPQSPKALMKLIDNPKNPITAAKVALGKKLFFDPRLSKSGLISCNTCHNLATGGIDGVEAAIGHRWTANPHHLNSPTVYNAVFFDKQFWDGRSPDLEHQAQGPIQAGPEMAATKAHVVNTVKSMPEYVKAFKRAYGKDVKITFEKVTDTIANFERTLVTPSRFDDYLNGKEDALNSTEKKGLKLFIDKGCVTCHNGIALGGGMNAFEITAKYKYRNVGDFKGDASGMVKVPTLRNITKTAPYFHNGAIWSLKEAIEEMGRIQLGVKLSQSDVQSIESFLKTLDGRVPKLKYPVLPSRTAHTPKPQL